MSQLPTLLQIKSTTEQVVETLHKYVTTCGGKSDGVTEIVHKADTLNATVDWLLHILPDETVVKVAKTMDSRAETIMDQPESDVILHFGEILVKAVKPMARSVETITIMDPLEAEVIEYLKDSQNWIPEISLVTVRASKVTVFFENLIR